MIADKYHLKPRDLCKLEGTTQLADTLLVSSTNEGGLYVLTPERVGVVDTRFTSGLLIHGDSLYRSVNHWDYQELIRYDADGTQTTLITLDIAETHDVRIYGEHLYTVSTGTNEILRFSLQGEVLEKWKYHGDGDSWHINCLDRWNGRIVASCFGKFDSHRAWKGKTNGAGIVFDILSQEVVWDDLNQPHNPYIDEHGIKYVCDSLRFRLLVDKGSGEHQEVKLPGFTRGLAFGTKHIYVGISQPRHVQNNPDGKKIGGLICIIDRETLDFLGTVTMPVSEVYDILVLN